MDLLHTDDTFSMIEALLSSELLPVAPVNTLQKRLHAVLDGTHEPWSYVIFWQPSYNDFSGESVLQWGDGVYKGRTRPRRKTAAAENEHQCELLRELSAMMDVDDDDDVEVKDTEWFYLGSMTWTFGSGSGLAGKAFTTYSPVWVTGSDQIFGSGCDRAKQGRDLGLQTMVCIPSGDGVLELGSTEQIRQNLDLFNKIRFLFNFEGSKSYFGAPNSQLFPAQFEIGSSSTVTDSPNPNPVYPHIHNKSSWESTSRVRETRSFGNMNPNAGQIQNGHSRREARVVPVRRMGRRLGQGNEEPISHMEAERMRREKLNQRFYALRAVIPKVAKRDKVTLLEHVIRYIKELKLKVDNAESEKNHMQIQLNELKEKLAGGNEVSSVVCENELESGLKVDVNVMGCDAMIRVESSKRNHPGARMMNAFMDLELELNHASISVVNDIMVQQATVKMETRSYTQEQIMRLSGFFLLCFQKIMRSNCN